MTRSDAELLALASRTTRFPRVRPPLRDLDALVVQRQTGSDTAALDLTAETFAQAWHASRRFQRHGRRLGGAVAVRDRAQPAAPVPQAQPHRVRGARAPRDADRMGRVRGLRGRRRADGRHFVDAAAPPRRACPAAEQRKALELRVVQQLDYEEVAGALGCTQNAARLRVSRALRALGLKLRGAEA